jgi:creatinine amidohydrolase
MLISKKFHRYSGFFTVGEERATPMANWEDLTMPGFETLRQQTQTVILPLGSLEEHGPHLPLGTDTFHALEVARRAADLHPLVVAPPLFYGMCRSTREHPGTVSISGDTLRALLVDVGREFQRQGLRNLVFISGHAGGTHISAIVEAGEHLLTELSEVRVAVVNLLELLREVLLEQPDLVHTKGDSHAGEVETAVMLAAYPDLIQGTATEEWPSFPKYILVRDKRRYWPGGVWGNPAPAAAAQGEAIMQAEAVKLAKVIKTLEELEG